jgi:hypothetical protein
VRSKGDGNNPKVSPIPFRSLNSISISCHVTLSVGRKRRRLSQSASLRRSSNVIPSFEVRSLAPSILGCPSTDLDRCFTEFTDCAAGRTISVSWACRGPFKAMQNCMKPQFVHSSPSRALSTSLTSFGSHLVCRRRDSTRRNESGSRRMPTEGNQWVQLRTKLSRHDPVLHLPHDLYSPLPTQQSLV